MAKGLSTRHLIGIKNITEDDIRLIFETADNFKEVINRPIKKVPSLRDITVANLFFESSTRTRVSFELAERRLSADIVNFTASSSSVSKGETLLDTVNNILSMKVDIVVMRHPAPGACVYLASRIPANIINAGARDATHVLDGLLEHEAELSIEERYTDTSGYTEKVFGLYYLLGYRFAPRMRRSADKKLFTFAAINGASPLAKLVSGRIKATVIEENWAEVLRLAASIQQGTVSSSLMLAKLAAYPRQNQLAQALREPGRVERTLFTLAWLESPELRRRVGQGLNNGEERNALARAAFFHRRGMAQEPRPEAMQNRACGLDLVVAAITLWNTVHLERAVGQLADRQTVLPEDCVRHLSPLAWDHILLTGEYRWQLAT